MKVWGRGGVVVLIAGGLVLLPSAGASAHPLGNFTVNHYDGMHVYSDRIVDDAIVDTAEIPTFQERSSVDVNHDGTVTAEERSAFAASRCASLATAVHASLAGMSLRWQVARSSFAYRPGAVHLDTSRLECILVTRVYIAQATRLTIADSFEAGRIGWHEVTAVATGEHLVDSPVPAMSVSDRLLHYPNDLLSSPLDVRGATLSISRGSGPSTYVGTSHLPTAGIVSRGLARLTGVFDRLIDTRHLSVPLALLAVLMSVALGASHAALPGHGKTVMAAYLAARQGRPRDALVVGATVTVTHTLGVLLLGLILTVSASLAGETVLSWLTLASGATIALIGAGLLRGAWRQRRHERAHHLHPHDHSHDHGHPENHEHRRRNLLGLGIAGGLVPSPSALVVLLGAIALGRTAFGVALVLGYGFGMAATLTAVGLALVYLRARVRRATVHRAMHRIARVAAVMPLVTAGVVTTVGLGLAARGIAPLTA